MPGLRADGAWLPCPARPGEVPGSNPGAPISSADQQIIFGALILVVVAGYGRERRLRDRV
jgi:hypothetical protein